MKDAHAQAVDTFAEEPRGFQNEVVRIVPRERSRRTAHLKGKRRTRFEPDVVTRAGKRYETFQIMIAIRPPPHHVERQVDLGRRAGGKRQRHGTPMPQSGTVGKMARTIG
ncbi:hypothetical protein MAE02_07980 [Microvirga aerophila]|uniref:Uncharacterized protein n=1 Tax=Microvirga aerophila TaxID=670291 RepID=A0A512BMB8_9HYPH|nr:hypothetical protein MAE02_07980 [Microvirga aerophila]